MIKRTTQSDLSDLSWVSYEVHTDKIRDRKDDISCSLCATTPTTAEAAVGLRGHCLPTESRIQQARAGGELELHPCQAAWILTDA